MFQRATKTVFLRGVAIAALTLKEVVFERYEGMGQDTTGVWASPDGTLVAWFKDPGGNVLSLAQFVS